MMDLPFDIVELVACPAVAESAPLREMAFRSDAWTPGENEAVVAAFRADMSLVDIAAELGRTLAAVRLRITDLGVRRHSAVPWSEWDDELLQRRYGSEPVATLAAELGRSIPSTYARARLLGLSEPASPPYSPWEDAQLRAGYARGVPLGQLAALIGRPLVGIASRAGKLGLRHANKPADWSDAEAARALERAAAGARYSTVRAQLAGEGFPFRSKPAFNMFILKTGYRRGWGRPWTAEEEALVRQAYANGEALTPVLERLGRKRTQLRWKVEELGLQGTHARPDGFRLGPAWSSEDTDFLRANYTTMATTKIAELLNRSVSGIQQRAWAIGLRKANYRPISIEERRAIQIAYDFGLSLGDLAEAFGRDVAIVHRNAVRLGLRFSQRSNKAARGPRADRRSWSIPNILALADTPAPCALFQSASQTPLGTLE